MELSYEDKLRLENTKEHLQVILGNLRIVNGELTTVLEQVKEERLKLKDVMDYREKIVIANLDITFTQNQRHKDLDRREVYILQRENEIELKDKEHEENISKALKELEDINSKIALAKSNYENSTTTQENEIETLKDKIITLKKEIGNYEEKIKEQFGIETKLKNENDRLSCEIEEAQKRLGKFNLEASKEMEETNKLIDTEKEKIKNPLELVRKETEQLEQLNRDLATIKARLTIQFKEQNPKRNLPIELQENK